MAEEMEKQLWQKFLDQHQSLVSSLDAHASLLAEMRRHCTEGGPAVGLIETRLVTTENLIATFKESAESLREATKQEENLPEVSSHQIPCVPAPKPHIPTQPVVDPSGLFAVDPNPTPVEQLFRNQSTGDRPKKQAKRKASDLEPQTHVGNGHSGNAPQVKKARPAHQNQEETVEDDDSFVRGVEARSRAKAERKLTKMEKKRKRQSEGSTNSVIKGPKAKKQKQKHAQKLPAATNPANAERDKGRKGNKRAEEEVTSNGTEIGQPSKKRKKSKS